VFHERPEGPRYRALMHVRLLAGAKTILRIPVHLIPS
jgi:hypothetical protein